jgi:hypothetical protein
MNDRSSAPPSFLILALLVYLLSPLHPCYPCACIHQRCVALPPRCCPHRGCLVVVPCERRHEVGLLTCGPCFPYHLHVKDLCWIKMFFSNLGLARISLL